TTSPSASSCCSGSYRKGAATSPASRKRAVPWKRRTKNSAKSWENCAETPLKTALLAEAAGKDERKTHRTPRPYPNPGSRKSRAGMPNLREPGGHHERRESMLAGRRCQKADLL